MRKILIFILLFIIIASNAQTQYSRVKINLRDNTIKKLVAYGVEVDHGIFNPGKYFIGELSSSELKKIKSAGFEYKVMIADVQKNLLAKNEEIVTRDNDNCWKNPKKEYKIPKYFHLGSLAGNLT